MASASIYTTLNNISNAVKSGAQIARPHLVGILPGDLQLRTQSLQGSHPAGALLSRMHQNSGMWNSIWYWELDRSWVYTKDRILNLDGLQTTKITKQIKWWTLGQPLQIWDVLDIQMVWGLSKRCLRVCVICVVVMEWGVQPGFCEWYSYRKLCSLRILSCFICVCSLELHFDATLSESVTLPHFMETWSIYVRHLQNDNSMLWPQHRTVLPTLPLRNICTPCQAAWKAVISWCMAYTVHYSLSAVFHEYSVVSTVWWCMRDCLGEVLCSPFFKPMYPGYFNHVLELHYLGLIVWSWIQIWGLDVWQAGTDVFVVCCALLINKVLVVAWHDPMMRWKWNGVAGTCA